MFDKEWKVYKEEIKEAWKDLKTKGRRRRQIPNILTSLRLLAPVFILPSAFLGNIPFVIGSFIAFSVTDMLDGFIARKFNFTSKLGRDLDAFSDKIFAGTLLLASSIINPILLLNFSLEACIAGINVNAKLKGVEAKSLIIGKVKTAFLFPLLGCSFIYSTLSIEPLFNLLFASTTLLQVLTISSYHRNYKTLIENKVEEKESVVERETELVEMEEKDKELGLGEKKLTKTSSDLESLRDIRKSLVEEKEETTKPFYKIKR